MTKRERTDRNFNNEPLQPDEELVLQPFYPDGPDSITNPDSIVIFSRGGKNFKTYLKAFPKEYAAMAWEQFNSWVDDQLPQHRDGRCMIPQEDGSYKECPRKRGNNHPACTDCPYKGKLDRKDKTELSIERLAKAGKHPSQLRTESPEEMFVMKDEHEQNFVQFINKLQVLVENQPKWALGFLLLCQKIKGEEFAEKMRLGHDAANKLRKKISDYLPQSTESIADIDFSDAKSSRSKLDGYYREEAQKFLELLIEMYASLT